MTGLTQFIIVIAFLFSISLPALTANAITNTS